MAGKVLDVFEDIRIVEVVEAEVGKPRNDGTPGCALYSVPFRLSAKPPMEWSQLFVRAWDSPVTSYTNRHRSGIARVFGDRVVLDGTTLEEIEQWHLGILKAACEWANGEYKKYLDLRAKQQEAERAEEEEHRRQVSEAVKRLEF